MNKIAEFIKTNRKEAGLTQEEFAIRSGLGLRFVRELEQGKETVRMDKVNEALAMFRKCAKSFVLYLHFPSAMFNGTETIARFI